MLVVCIKYEVSSPGSLAVQEGCCLLVGSVMVCILSLFIYLTIIQTGSGASGDIIGVLYTPPHVPMDSMSTHVQSTLSLHGLHKHSMSTWCGVHEESMDFMAVFPTVYMESIETF
jgi:hypothetical protein